ncbi:monooxygenase [Coprinopsis cinerea okayama7|uniref:Monooxygenase n=1 Tax=Coprinopsis cinerea (strain Okayama-7 / 130 / ATCC MYA-4618 / FGSC 9003) TaxID=240176 RepID=A8N867_COPC7|nr:monooxygenase [Coprinopsis cinerea okayama7\|eukprot:XP_001831023.1 monooxygenase [Coprinopsis cinerea okayama7\
MSFPPIPNNTLPALSLVKSTLPANLDPASVDAKAIAQGWLAAFRQVVSEQPSPDAVISLFVPASSGAQVWWRDMLALTWDFRTFVGADAIRQFATDRLSGSAAQELKLHDIQLVETPSDITLPPVYTPASPDLVWIQFFITFKTAVGHGSGIIRIVPVGVSDLPSFQDSKNWKAHIIYTNLEGLLDHPERIGALRDPRPNHGLWAGARQKEVECEGEKGKPTVLIVGGGQSGLEIAARLKVLGVKSLIIEQNERVGDNWRNRYDALCLHDPVWYDHMPYLPFPPNWPIYSPSVKLANWLEHYAEIMELNVWLSSTIQSIKQDPETGKWDVTVLRKVKGPDSAVKEEAREFEAIHHLVMATGQGSGVPEIPSIPGEDRFKRNDGTVLHSTEHKRAADHRGKKVIVVGACTSAHDICADYYHNGVDVTMFQRSSTYIMSVDAGWKGLFEGVYDENSPPVDVADRLTASFPHWASIPLNQDKVKYVAELDKPILDALHKVGFRTNLGYQDSGVALLAWGRGGGYYLDTGASGLIAEGKIKLKNDSQIKEFTERGLRFEDGSELQADVVLFATGYGDPMKRISRLLGEDLAKECTGLWGFNQEGEILGAWRDLGIKRFWYMIGNLALCRFHSKHLALQIKAQEEGLFGKRYSATS